MKKALEAHWAGATDAAALLQATAAVEAGAWRAQAEAGVERVGLDGTLYDQVLDAAFQLGLVPPRFQVGGDARGPWQAGPRRSAAARPRLNVATWRGRGLTRARAPNSRQAPLAATCLRIDSLLSACSAPSASPCPCLQALALPAGADDPYAPGGGLGLYFALARGAEGAPALDMSK